MTFGPAPIRRLMAAQDTGAAVCVRKRADSFTGTDDAAVEAAGRMLPVGLVRSSVSGR